MFYKTPKHKASSYCRENHGSNCLVLAPTAICVYGVYAVAARREAATGHLCSLPVFHPYIVQVFFEPHSLVWFQYHHTSTREPLPEAEGCALFLVRHGVLCPAGLSSTLKSAGTKCKPYFLSRALSIAQGRQIKRSPGMDTYQFALSPPLFCFLFWTSCQVFSNVP